MTTAPDLPSHGPTEPSARALPPRLERLLVALTVIFVVANLAPDLPDVPAGLYVPLHAVMEVFAVVVASLVFTLGWHGRRDEVPCRTQLVSCAFLSVALLDLGHLLSTQGMPDFVTPAGPEKGIAFWLPGRFVDAFALLVASTSALQAPRRNCAPLMLGASLGFSAAVFALVLGWPELLPRTFVPGEGLTPFKIRAEYAIVAVHALTVVLLWRKLGRDAGFDVRGLLAAAAVMGMSELFFTLYSAPHDGYLMLGHVYKVVAYALVYRAVYVDSVRRPHDRLRAAEERERRAIAAALDASEARFQAMADTVPCILYTRREDGTMDFVNRRALEYSGIDAGRLRTEWPGAVHPDDARRLKPAYLRAQATRTAYDLELRLRAADGSYRWFAGSARPIVENGQARWFGALTDIEALKRQEAALRLNEAALRRADQRKDEFLAILAHELRSPLAPLRTALEVLRRAGGDDARRIAAEDMMERQVRQMARLIDDLLDQSRIATGKLQLRQTAIDLREVARSAADDVAAKMALRGHALAIDASPEPLPVHGDPARLVQVVVNLLSNAAKYTPRGGRIVLRAKREGDAAVVAVEDNGVGIAAEDLERVFEMFTQLHGPPGHGEEGLGIGLHLARRIVELHGGRLGAASAGAGRGSTFTVTLPLAASVATPAPAPVEAPASSRRRVLVVDDNPDAADSLASLLQLMGHDARAATAGADAVALAERTLPELVLLDLGMPDMDGFEVARRLRALPGGDRVRIVAVTGWGQDADKRRSRAAGFDAHVTKPVAPADLERLLRHGVARARA